MTAPVARNDFEHLEATRDLIGLLNELADLLAASARAGYFGHHLVFCTRADLLLDKLARTVAPAVRSLHDDEAAAVIERLRGQFQLIDVQGRA